MVKLNDNSENVLDAKGDPGPEGGDGRADKGNQERSDSDPVVFLRNNYNRGRDWLTRAKQAEHHRSYAAYRNKHHDRSKYRSPRYKGRSSYFRPKTRNSVINNMNVAQQSLFASVSPVSITANFDQNPADVAGAMVLKELLEIYIDPATPYCGMNWELITLGARQTADIAGIVVSKVYWVHKEREERYIEAIQEQMVSEAGVPMVYTDTGEPVMVVREEEGVETTVEAHHPMVDLVAPEETVIDPGAHWTNPVQTAQFASFGYPVDREWLKSVLADESDAGMGATGWHLDDMSVLNSASGTDYQQQSKGVRQQREGGHDRYGDTGSRDSQTIWIRENFVRLKGVDWHFWSIGKEKPLSTPKPVEEAYPEHKGKRPYHIGFGAIEAFNAFPEAPVHALQSQQAEINDFANLRIDSIKETVVPTVKVVRGRRVDVDRLNNRYPGMPIQVDAPDDVQWERGPDLGSSIYQESSLLDTMFDEAAGVFSGSSVQNTRQLNETVGGMRMLSGGAAATSQFNMRIFEMTWYEPVMRQLVACIRYYVADEDAIKLAARKAQLFKRYQTESVTEDMLSSDIQLRVKSSRAMGTPEERIREIMLPLLTLGQLFGPAAREILKKEEVIEEVFARAGQKDGARFVDYDKLEQLMNSGQKPDPEMVKLKADMEKVKMQVEGRLREKEMTLASEERREGQRNMIDVSQAERDRITDIVLEVLKLNAQQEQAERAETAKVTQAAISASNRGAAQRPSASPSM
jgi:hypothetical protein